MPVIRAIHTEMKTRKFVQSAEIEVQYIQTGPQKNVFLVQECCRRRFFFVKNCVFGPGTLPQAPFFVKKIRFWSWNVAAGAFFEWKNVVLGRGLDLRMQTQGIAKRYVVSIFRKTRSRDLNTATLDRCPDCTCFQNRLGTLGIGFDIIIDTYVQFQSF